MRDEDGHGHGRGPAADDDDPRQRYREDETYEWYRGRGAPQAPPTALECLP
ncbi:hypothetical protein [Streptacidiphilus anmyonensis]|uniref:hypothetical protein n=1 Tax=Streptacidiphilus anmyonensis TaxID=405782 RepID=UPI000AC0935C|nr:hypothetical protein [Streptacidiphilus anmyonensis]